MQGRKALGRGLDSLFGPAPAEPEAQAIKGGTTLPSSPAATIPIDAIVANRFQPREIFNDQALEELALSIKEYGLIQPLVVSPRETGGYELIAGERRWRASRMAGLKEVPVIVRETRADGMLELALIENIQRENLNPMEEACAYQSLKEKFQMGEADIAEKVGKSREHVTNIVRLLKLPKILQEDVAGSKLSASHARALLGLSSTEEMIQFRNKIIRETLSVRDVEEMVRLKSPNKAKRRGSVKKDLSGQIKLLIEEMEKALATKVRLQQRPNGGQGNLVIEFYSWQDLDRIYRKIVQ